MPYPVKEEVGSRHGGKDRAFPAVKKDIAAEIGLGSRSRWDGLAIIATAGPVWWPLCNSLCPVTDQLVSTENSG